MVQVLRGKGGVGGLKAERAEAATTNALKHLLPAKTSWDGALQSDRQGTFLYLSLYRSYGSDRPLFHCIVISGQIWVDP